MKTCTKCKKEKSLNDFHKHSGQKSGLQPRCKKCTKNFYNKRYAQSLEVRQRKAELQHIKWTTDSVWRESHIQRNKEFYLKNKRALVEKGRAYIAERRKRDIGFKIKGNLRARLWTALKNNIKSGSAVSDLGCSIQQLKTYLESKFQPGMSWDNWSKTGWHLDHKIPLANFDLTDPQQFKKAIHFTNLQPMWAKDNLRKGARL